MTELPGLAYGDYNRVVRGTKLCAVCGMVIGIPIAAYGFRFHLAPKALRWCNYFRAIHSSLETRQPRKSEITGVAYCDAEEDEIEVPVNPNVTFHHSQSNTQDKKIYMDCDCQPSWSECECKGAWHGLSVHSTCWDVVDRVVGPLALCQLDNFVEAMRQVWKVSYPYRPYALNEVIDGTSDEGNCMFFWAGDSLQMDLSRFSGLLNAGALIVGDWFLPISTVSIPLADPFHVPGLQRLVKRCKTYSNTRSRGTASRAVTRAYQQHKTLFDRSRSYSLNLPLDICLMIFDELFRSPLDAVNAVDAFHWRFPDGVWKKKLPLDIIVELDGISTDDFDWRHFFIEFSRLMETTDSQGMASRKRIFTVVNAIRDEFLGRISEQVSRIDESIKF